MNLIQVFIDLLGHENVLSDEALKNRYVHIWKMDEGLLVQCVVLPRSTEHVAAIVKICHERNQSIVVHGGLTNLVGSTEVNNTDVVLSLEKLNAIEEIDAESRTMTVQTGVILEAIHSAAQSNNLLFPLSFGAKGSAQIGGVISTNAGGVRVLKYGMTRQLILGLEVVLADGSILSSMKKIVKDNSGYDLKQLFIGAEGTLGIITKAVLKLVELPQSRVSAFIGVASYTKVVSLLKFLDHSLSGKLSGFELIWKDTYKAMTSQPSMMSPPLPHDYEYYVLIEMQGVDQVGDQMHLENCLAEALEKSLLEDAVLASNQSDLNWFWTIREDVAVLVSQMKLPQYFDISIPIPLIGKVIADMQAKLEKVTGVTHVYTFGHVADGNIHFLIGKKDDSPGLASTINDIVYAPLEAIGGSVSAEHGIGMHKKAYLKFCRNDIEIKLMKQLKESLDPKGILNPGKIF